MIPSLQTPVTMTLHDVLLLLETLLCQEAGQTHLPATLERLRGRLGDAPPAVQGISFREAVQASLRARAHCRPSTLSDLRSYTARMLAFQDIADMPLDRMDIALCKTLMDECFKHSPHVQRKAQSVLHSIFTYGIRHGWCLRNPATAIDLRPAKEREVRPLGLRQIRRLLKCCQLPEFRSMDAAVRLMLWCGIRPGEVQRLRWGDIDPREGVVYISPQHSKTGGARVVPLHGAALVLAEEEHPVHEHIAPPSWCDRWKKLRQAAKLNPWQQDTLRHSFASYHLKHFHNIVRLQEEMGHRDSSLLRTRYLNLRYITRRDAGIFFNKIR